MKFTHLISGIRLILLFISNRGKLKVSSPWIHIGKDVKIMTCHGSIFLNSKLYLSDRVTLSAVEKGSIIFGAHCFVNENTRFVSLNKIIIGDNCRIADNVSVYDHDHAFFNSDKLIADQGFVSDPIKIGNNVWIGSHVVICKGVTIGDNSVIGASTLVLKDVPPNSVCGGVPAKILKMRIIT